MFSNIKARFKANPNAYYALSIAASWAGVGSLMNSVTMTKTYGIVPSVIWSLGNSVACVLFGLIACKLPTLRDLMRTKAVKYAIGIISIFQLWLNMNGIREICSDTPIGHTGGTIVVYVVCIAFIILLLRFGMIRNVLTDSVSWVTVYGLIFLVTVAAYCTTKTFGAGLQFGTDWANMKVGIEKSLLLLPGPFTFPYFYEILDYNDHNEDGTAKIDVKKAFSLGGFMFGWYMVFTFCMAFPQFEPWQNIIKAVLVSIIGISTISTFIYSEYIVFGRKAGLVIDSLAVLLWPLLISLGVMGVWTLMSQIRVYLVLALLLAAVVKRLVDKRKEATAE